MNRKLKATTRFVGPQHVILPQHVLHDLRSQFWDHALVTTFTHRHIPQRLATQFLSALNPCVRPLRTRFAPSPTGYLHAGHVLSALYVWTIGRDLGADIALRIEDHDLSRSRPEFETAIWEDLAWLGFVDDLASVSPYRVGQLWKQSEHTGAYVDALRSLAGRGLVYACDCTRRDIGSSGVQGTELHYSGRCRTRGLPLPDFSKAGPAHGIRLNLAAAGQAAGLPSTVAFDDLLLGPQLQTPAEQCGDFLLRDRHGQWTYQFAVVVDDFRHGCNLIIRGEDLLASTGRQILLAQVLGRADAIRFLHHPLLTDADGLKLSKRTLAEGIRAHRERGKRPGDVLTEISQHLKFGAAHE